MMTARFFALLTAALILLASASSHAGDERDALYRRGVEAYVRFSDHDIRAASRLFRETVDRFPDFSPAQAALAESLVQEYIRGEQQERPLLDAASASAEKALFLDAKSPEAHKAIASVYLARGKTEAAIEELERAVDMAPDYARAWLNLGAAWLKKKENRVAEGYFRKALEVGGDPLAAGIANFNLATLRAGEKRQEEALALYAEAAEKTPRYQGIHFGRGVALMHLERDEEAIKSFQQAISLKEDYADAWFGLAAANHRMGREKEAETAYHELLKLDPESEEAERGLRALKGKKAGCLFFY